MQTFLLVGSCYFDATMQERSDIDIIEVNFDTQNDSILPVAESYMDYFNRGSNELVHIDFYLTNLN